ncbi:MAG: hypothetical protein KA314_04605 [Chloroflexi bacterium]|nr:hypothetical protein [Chloroflexota bacterium]
MKDKFDTSIFDAPVGGAESGVKQTPPAEKPAKRGRTKSPSPQFDTPITASARLDVARASGHGGEHLGNEKHKQLTFRIPWEWVDEIEQWGNELGISKEEMKRYLVRRGLDALKSGDRPRVRPHVVRNMIEY